MIRPQKDFPLMDEYKNQGFAISDKTIFALGEDIYTDYPLTNDLLVHELVHLRQQKEVGVKEWVYDFLYTPSLRLKYEVEAYREQLKSIKDGNRRFRVYIESANNLSSPLYGSIVTKKEALELLKV